MSETTTTKQSRVPQWIWTVVFASVGIGMVQVPKALHAYNLGAKAGSSFCSKYSSGYKKEAAFNAVMAEMEDVKYTKRYESLAKAGFNNEMMSCPAIRAAAASRWQ